MFYRHLVGGRRKPIDLWDLYGGDLFLCGGHPSLVKEDLTIFSKHGVASMAMNNTGTLFKPTFWVCADKPACYSRSILLDTSVLKFARLAYQAEGVDGRKWRDIPGTLFYGISEDYKPTNLLYRRGPLAWFKNVFIIALQIAFRLGFRRVFLCGTGFSIAKDQQYAYDARLTEGQVKSNQRCYSGIVRSIQAALPHFREHGFELNSCTPESPINEFLPYYPLSKALSMVVRPDHDTINVLHSSELSKPPTTEEQNES